MVVVLVVVVVVPVVVVVVGGGVVVVVVVEVVVVVLSVQRFSSMEQSVSPAYTGSRQSQPETQSVEPRKTHTSSNARHRHRHLPLQFGVVVVGGDGVVGVQGFGAGVVVVGQLSTTRHPVTAIAPQTGFAGGTVGA